GALLLPFLQLFCVFVLIFIIIYVFTWSELKPTMCKILTSHLKCGESMKTSPAPQSSNSPDEQEIESLVEMMEWPEPPAPINFQASTSPNTTDFYLLTPASSHHVGDHVKVLIMARDHRGHPKTYGGDYFKAKLHSQSLKAAVTGSVTDHRNGTYTASFLLLWPGTVSISIVLIHSSEAISILREKRENRYFADNGTTAEVECNVIPPSNNVCTYHDQGTSERWYCTHPLNLPCTAYIDHSAGSLRKIYTPTELQYFFREQWIIIKCYGFQYPSSSFPSWLVTLPGPCTPGLMNLDPSGFFYQDVWISRSCRNRPFPDSVSASSCLHGRVLYMFGDSTLRQWWEYLVNFIPSVPSIPDHTYMTPHLSHHSYTILFICDLHYIANELDAFGGGHELPVILINCNAHLIPFPIRVYIRRIQTIRDAVVRLLKRSPKTQVFIKSGNTGYLYAHGSDWLSFQLDTVMRLMFSGLPVTILDTWQMTSCHYLPTQLHPAKILVKNEVDLMLSFLCPQ
uniref:NXPE C-terminal domain-containing protein n=1 Tax=Leptobrachium leishanense TaxID=445787 RepID=A0A8C5PVV4_9ANUR